MRIRFCYGRFFQPMNRPKLRWTCLQVGSYKRGVSMQRPLVRIRSARPGPERRLIQAALKCGLPVSTQEVFILREAELPTGVPDLIAIEPRARVSLPVARRKQLHSEHLKLLHFLNDCGPASADEIVNLLNVSPKRTPIILADLVSADVVVKRGDRYAPRSVSEVFVAKRIVAVEAKVRSWRKALEQAVANLWFASHSYILVPALNCLCSICHEARAFGVGVLVFDGRETRTALRPRKQPIPASYGSWLINEWVLGQMR